MYGKHLATIAAEIEGQAPICRGLFLFNFAENAETRQHLFRETDNFLREKTPTRARAYERSG